VAGSLSLDEDGPTRRKFLARLQGEISKRGTIDVLRHGIKHGAHHIDVFYGIPSPGNPVAKERYDANRFSVTRQLRYSRDETQLSLDLAIFINGLPIATFELKNSLTKQTVEDAIQQYRRDRDPREKLFEFGRCVVHFALDEHEVRFCTHLKGKESWFLPLNKGWNDGAGNPPISFPSAFVNVVLPLIGSTNFLRWDYWMIYLLLQNHPMKRKKRMRPCFNPSLRIRAFCDVHSYFVLSALIRKRKK